MSTSTDKTIKLEKVGEGQVEDYWAATLRAPYRRIKYTFEVIGEDGSHKIVGDRGVYDFNEKPGVRWELL